MSVCLPGRPYELGYGVFIGQLGVIFRTIFFRLIIRWGRGSRGNGDLKSNWEFPVQVPGGKVWLLILAIRRF